MFHCFWPYAPAELLCGKPLELPVMTADTLPAHVLISGMGVTMACESLYDKVEFEWAL